MDLRETYNRIAEDWHRDHSNDDWWKEGTDLFVSKLPKNGQVLDVGCGSGVKTKYLVDRGFKVVGVDIAENLLAIAKRESPGTRLERLSMYDLDELNEKFDGVFAQASMLHIPRADAPEIVKGMARRLTPGGFLYIAVKEIREGKPLEELKVENDYGYPYERFFSYFTMDELEQYMVDAGLRVKWKERKPSGRTVWLQIIAKGC